MTGRAEDVARRAQAVEQTRLAQEARAAQAAAKQARDDLVRDIHQEVRHALRRLAEKGYAGALLDRRASRFPFLPSREVAYWRMQIGSQHLSGRQNDFAISPPMSPVYVRLYSDGKLIHPHVYGAHGVDWSQSLSVPDLETLLRVLKGLGA